MTTIAQPMTRAAIADRIATLKAKHDRLPRHYEDQRAAIMREIDGLVDDWLAASA